MYQRFPCGNLFTNMRFLVTATCGQDPCLNGGVCVHDTSLPYSFRCECPAGLAGKICDTGKGDSTRLTIDLYL